MQDKIDKYDLKKGRYKHFKGREYELIDIVTHSESLEKLVLYRALYDSESALWVRPISMWNELVTINGKSVPRFEYITWFIWSCDEY